MDTDKDPRTHAIIGAAFEVHNHLGPGFLEGVYQEALAVELAARGVPCSREIELQVIYKGAPLRCTYRADLLCFDEIIVEVKAVRGLAAIDQAQLLNYLKASSLRLGLLLNFGASRLEVKRLRFDPERRISGAPANPSGPAATDGDFEVPTPVTPISASLHLRSSCG